MRLRSKFATMSRVVRMRQKRRADTTETGARTERRARVPWPTKTER